MGGLQILLNRMNQTQRDAAVMLCTFQLNVLSANVLIKFPCNYFVEWRTANSRVVLEGQRRVAAKQGVVQFDEVMEMTTEMIREGGGRYFKKETQLNLNLVSKSRQDQVKLVGRVTLDLAELANSSLHASPRTHRLAYCSVDADITFSAVLKSQRPTSLAPHELDKSSFNDFFSLYTAASRDHGKREAVTECEQETSIGNRSPTLENVIDDEGRGERERGQMFFYVPAGRTNGFNRSITNEPPSRSKDKEQNYMQGDLSLRSPPVIRPAPIAVPKILKQQRKDPPRDEKTRTREEFEGNKQKVQQLQRKIYELCLNLQDSKRSTELYEKMNRDKEELIKQLKRPQQEARDNHLHLKEYIELEERCEKMQRERREEERRGKEVEEGLRKQLALYQGNLQTLNRETEDMRRMWVDKKEHFEEKVRLTEERVREREDKIREREARVRELEGKLEEALKFKYQYELVKELTDEKDQKLRLVEKDLNRITFELEELLKNNPSEELYQLRHAQTHNARTIEQLQAKLTRSEEEVNKYKENYVKMETAYQIQSNNYNTAIEKQAQIEAGFQSYQKENYELKDHLAAALKRSQDYQLRYHQTQDQRQQLAKAHDELTSNFRNSAEQLAAAGSQIDAERAVSAKLKAELEGRQLEYEEKIRQLQGRQRSSQQVKQVKDQQFEKTKQQLQANLQSLTEVVKTHQNDLEQHQAEARRLTSELAQLQQQNQVLKLQIQQLQRSHSTQLESRLQQIRQLETTVAEQSAALGLAQTAVADTENALRETANSLKETAEALREAEEALQERDVLIEEKEAELTSTLYALQSTEEALKTSEDALREAEDLLRNHEDKLRQKQEALRQKDTLETVIQQLEDSIKDKANTIRQLQEGISTAKAANKQLAAQVEELTATQKQLQLNIAILEEQSQKILFILEHKEEIQKEMVEIRSGFTSCMFELEQEKAKSSSLQLKLHETLQQLETKEEEVGNRTTELEEYNHLLEEYKRSQQAAKQEAVEAQSELAHLKNIIREINDRYEQHSKIQQKFQEELQHLRGEKEEVESTLTNNNQKLLQHITQLEEQVGQLHADMEKMEAEHGQQVEERVHYERTAAEQTQRADSCSLDNERLLKEIEEVIRKRDESIERVDQKDKEIVGLNTNINQLNTQLTNLLSRVRELEAALGKEQAEKDRLDVQLQQHIDETAQLEQERETMLHEINDLRTQTQQILSQYVQPTTPIMQAEDHPDHNSNLHELLLESDRKNQALQQQVHQLLLEIDQLSHQASNAIFSNFNQFSNQQLQKIVDEQRLEINRLEQERNNRGREAAALEMKVKELEKSIVELQATFKLEIDRLSSDRSNRENFQGELTVIAEERDEEEMYKSEKSLMMHSASRIKSLEGDLHELRERNQMLNEEKLFLEEQLQASEEEKFGLLSVINEKDIALETALRGKMIAEMERDDLQPIVTALRDRNHRLEEENENLKNQVNFGSTINLHEHSVTRSEPVRSEEDRQNAELQSLRVQVQKYRCREEEMAWNMRDLEMQLQAATDNLDALNASNMNSVLSSRVIHLEKEEELGYSKEKLILCLKRNEELKEISHNLIRALKFRDQQAQQMIQTANQSRAIIEQLTANAAEMETLLRDFQGIKMWVLKTESGILQAQASKLLGEMREADIMKNLLAFQSRLRHITQPLSTTSI